MEHDSNTFQVNKKRKFTGVEILNNLFGECIMSREKGEGNLLTLSLLFLISSDCDVPIENMLIKEIFTWPSNDK
jgi:hypothetical protein